MGITPTIIERLTFDDRLPRATEQAVLTAHGSRLQCDSKPRRATENRPAETNPTLSKQFRQKMRRVGLDIFADGCLILAMQACLHVDDAGR
jgi:hypothetical protein